MVLVKSLLNQRKFFFPEFVLLNLVKVSYFRKLRTSLPEVQEDEHKPRAYPANINVQFVSLALKQCRTIMRKLPT